MYAAVPRIMPAYVAWTLNVGDTVSPRTAGTARRPSSELGEPEVENFDFALWRDLDVRGLEIAMDDAAIVRGFERVDDLPRNRQGFVDGPERSAFERLAVDQLHDDGSEIAGFLEPYTAAMLG